MNITLINTKHYHIIHNNVNNGLNVESTFLTRAQFLSTSLRHTSGVSVFTGWLPRACFVRLTGLLAACCSARRGAPTDSKRSAIAVKQPALILARWSRAAIGKHGLLWNAHSHRPTNGRRHSKQRFVVVLTSNNNKLWKSRPTYACLSNATHYAGVKLKVAPAMSKLPTTSTPFHGHRCKNHHLCQSVHFNPLNRRGQAMRPPDMEPLQAAAHM